MGLKNYIVGSLLFTIIILGYVFSIEAGDYQIKVVDFTLTLPIAVWIVIPMLVSLLLTTIHIFFYGLKNYFAVKAVSKDTQSIITLINKRLLNETSNANFQNKNLKEISSLLVQLEINVQDSNFSSENKDISKTVEQTFLINSGKYVPSKELKLEENNPLMLLNTKNRIELDDNFALEVLKSASKYSEEIVQFAFFKALESKSMTSIKKVLPELTLNNKMVKVLLKKDSQQTAEFAMENEQILNIIKKVELSNNELIQAIKDYKLSMTPDQIIALFENISKENEEYTTSYLYVLAEYEMIDKIRDILVNSTTDEYVSFKALVDLKDAGKNTYSLDALSYK